MQKGMTSGNYGRRFIGGQAMSTEAMPALAAIGIPTNILEEA